VPAESTHTLPTLYLDGEEINKEDHILSVSKEINYASGKRI